MRRIEGYTISRIRWTLTLPLLILSLFLVLGEVSCDAPVIDSSGSENSNVRAVMYFFYSTTCPHCRHALPFIEKLEQKYKSKGFVVRYENVYEDYTARELFIITLRNYGYDRLAVPCFIIGKGEPRFGFTSEETTGKKLEKLVLDCLYSKEGCPPPEEILKAEAELRGESLTETPEIEGTKVPETSSEVEASEPSAGAESGSERDEFNPESYSEPVAKAFRKFSPEKYGMLAFTVIIAGLDSINPCAFFILLSLLSLLLHARDRRKILIVGFTFVFTSGLIYFLYMTAWLQAFLLLKSVQMVNIVAGGIAVIIGIINVKDFFAFKKGISLTVSDSARSDIFARVRGLMSIDNILTLLVATVALAGLVNLYELLCTVGFPMAYTKVLTLQNLPKYMYYLYLALYNTVYVIPLAIIVIITAVTLGRRKLTEQEGRFLKLLSGYMMLALGIALIFKPVVLTEALSSLGVILIAIGLAGITYLMFADKLQVSD